LAGCVAFAADTGSSSLTSEFGPPPQFQNLKNLQSGNLFGNCLAPQVIQSAAGKKGFSGEDCGSDRLPRVPECNKVNERTIEQLEKEIKTAQDTMACQKSKMEGIQSQIACFRDQNSLFEQQLAAFQQAYNSKITECQNYMNNLKSLYEDRGAQRKDIGKLLAGDAAIGRKGLLEFEAYFQQAIGAAGSQDKGGIQNAIAKIVTDQKAVEQARASLEDTKKVQIGSSIKGCLHGLGASGGVAPQYKKFRCCQSDADPRCPTEWQGLVDARTYVQCRYYQNQFINERGEVPNDPAASLKGSAQAATNSLIGVLDAIEGRLAMNTQDGSKAGEIAGFADLDKLYGDALAKFNGKGLDIYAFYRAQFKSCESDAKTAVNKDLTRPKTALNTAAEDIKTKEMEVRKYVREQLNEYSKLYSDAMYALTGQHLPLDTTNCINATNPSSQRNCMTDLRNNMEALLAGRTPTSVTKADGSTIQMKVRGNNPRNFISFRCAGISGCIRSLQSMDSNIRIEEEKIKAERKNTVKTCNAAIQERTTAWRMSMNSTSSFISNLLGPINKALATVGVKPLRFEKVEAEQLEADSNQDYEGLYKVPTSAVKLIGGGLNPALLDVNEASIGEAYEGMSERMKDFAEKETDIASLRADIDALPAKCLSGLSPQVDAIKQATKDFKDNKCSSADDYCARENQENVSALIQAINDAMSEAEVSTMITDAGVSLSSGHICRSSSSPIKDLENELASAQEQRYAKVKACAAIPETDKVNTESCRQELALANTNLENAKKALDTANKGKGDVAANCNSISYSMAKNLNKLVERSQVYQGNKEATSAE